jgi:hypothetical protein
MTEPREPTAWEIFNDGRAFSAWAFDEDYDPPDDRGESEMPGSFPAENAADNVEETAETVADYGGGATGYAFDVATGENALPWWTKYAAAGGLLLVLLIALRPYASIGAGVIGE